MRRLCDSWTKRDDDKAETSRMGGDNDEVVEIDDNDEVNMVNVKVNPSGHKPRVDGRRWFNKTTQELGRGMGYEMRLVFQEDQDALLGRTPPYLYTCMRQL